MFPCETERLDALWVGRRSIGGCVLEDAECWPKCSKCAAGPVAQCVFCCCCLDATCVESAWLPLEGWVREDLKGPQG